MRNKIGFPKVKKVKKSTLKNKVDKLFSLKIRSQGYCTFKGYNGIKCSDTLQCMHVIGRANHRLRWDERNAFCGCSAHHIYYTHHPLEFYETVSNGWPDIWRYLMKHKNEMWDKNIEKVLENLEDKGVEEIK